MGSAPLGCVKQRQRERKQCKGVGHIFFLKKELIRIVQEIRALSKLTQKVRVFFYISLKGQLLYCKVRKILHIYKLIFNY